MTLSNVFSKARGGEHTPIVVNLLPSHNYPVKAATHLPSFERCTRTTGKTILCVDFPGLLRAYLNPGLGLVWQLKYPPGVGMHPGNEVLPCQPAFVHCT